MKHHLDGIILNDDIVESIKLAVETPRLPVIIEGETGTGKEEIAKIIHRRMSADGDVPLISINCSQLQGDLVMSTLFGHRRGSFTGAVETVPGAIEEANGGILFLDEFQRLSIPVQELLLRTMQDGSYTRVGEHRPRNSTFRLMIAVHKSLDQYMAEGTLLPDLRYRLYGIEIKVPPLRERTAQIEEFLSVYFSKQGGISKRNLKDLADACSKFYWQGNVRQLFGVLDLVVLKARSIGQEVSASLLPTHVSMLEPVSKQQVLGEAVSIVNDFVNAPWSYSDFIDTFERALFKKIMGEYKNISEVCEKLKLPRSTLDSKRKRLGLVGA